MTPMTHMPLTRRKFMQGGASMLAGLPFMSTLSYGQSDSVSDATWRRWAEMGPQELLQEARQRYVTNADDYDTDPATASVFSPVDTLFRGPPLNRRFSSDLESMKGFKVTIANERSLFPIGHRVGKYQLFPRIKTLPKPLRLPKLRAMTPLINVPKTAAEIKWIREYMAFLQDKNINGGSKDYPDKAWYWREVNINEKGGSYTQVNQAYDAMLQASFNTVDVRASVYANRPTELLDNYPWLISRVLHDPLALWRVQQTRMLTYNMLKALDLEFFTVPTSEYFLNNAVSWEHGEADAKPSPYYPYVLYGGNVDEGVGKYFAPKRFANGYPDDYFTRISDASVGCWLYVYQRSTGWLLGIHEVAMQYRAEHWDGTWYLDPLLAWDGRFQRRTPAKVRNITDLMLRLTSLAKESAKTLGLVVDHGLTF